MNFLTFVMQQYLKSAQNKDEFRTATEVLLKHVDNSLVFVNFLWELRVAMNSLLPGSSQIVQDLVCTKRVLEALDDLITEQCID